MRRLRLVVPVYNDWLSFNILLQELNQVASTLPVRLAVSAVNDGSTEAPEDSLTDL